MNWHYHQKCLTEVICNPDNFPEKLQMAYSLASSIKEDEEKRERLKRCVIELQDEYCVEGKPQPPADRLIKEGEQPAKL
jgi:hypothetical protein